MSASDIAGVPCATVSMDGRTCIRMASLGSGPSSVDMGTYFVLFDAKPDGIMVYVVKSHGNGYFAAKALMDGKTLDQVYTEALCSCARASDALRMFGVNVYTAVMVAVEGLNRILYKS